MAPIHEQWRPAQTHSRDAFWTAQNVGEAEKWGPPPLPSGSAQYWHLKIGIRRRSAPALPASNSRRPGTKAHHVILTYPTWAGHLSTCATRRDKCAPGLIKVAIRPSTGKSFGVPVPIQCDQTCNLANCCLIFWPMTSPHTKTPNSPCTITSASPSQIRASISSSDQPSGTPASYSTPSLQRRHVRQGPPPTANLVLRRPPLASILSKTARPAIFPF